MNTFLFYIKLLLIGLLSPLIIYFLNEQVSLLFIPAFLSPFSFLVDSFPIIFLDNGSPNFILEIVTHIFILLPFALSIVIVLIPSYLFINLYIQNERKKIAIVTSLLMSIFAYFSPFISSKVLDEMIIYYNLLQLSTMLLLNMFIIYKIPERTIIKPQIITEGK